MVILNVVKDAVSGFAPGGESGGVATRAAACGRTGIPRAVIPAKAGIHHRRVGFVPDRLIRGRSRWTPAFAGVTGRMVRTSNITVRSGATTPTTAIPAKAGIHHHRLGIARDGHPPQMRIPRHG